MSRRIYRSILALVPIALIALVVWRLLDTSSTTAFKARFESAVGLYPGSDVQVLGVRVGTVTAVTPRAGDVVVSMELDPDQAVGADTKAVIVAPTLVSDRFVQLTEPYVSGPRLRGGTTIPLRRTAVPVEIDDLYASLTDAGRTFGPNGVNRNGALSDFLDVAARNLRGQGVDINRMIDESAKASGTLADSGDDLFATIANLKEFNDMLVENDQSVARVNRQFAEVTDYLADDRQELAAAIDNLGQALAIVDDFIRDNRGNLRTSVRNLQGPTQVLVNQRASLEESVRLMPLVLQNFLRAYNPSTNTLDGRGNLNEASIWLRQPAPTLLPGVDQ